MWSLKGDHRGRLGHSQYDKSGKQPTTIAEIILVGGQPTHARGSSSRQGNGTSEQSGKIDGSHSK